MRYHLSFRLMHKPQSRSIWAPKSSNSLRVPSCVNNSSMKSLEGKYDTAASRWAGVGPYYAMFPTTFADGVIEKYTQPGDTVLDPFAGRGTAVFSAAVNGRCGIGIELNPVGWVYARAKLRPAPLKVVEERISELSRIAPNFRRAAAELPEFFHHCFTANVRRFLCAARSELDWSRRA